MRKDISLSENGIRHLSIINVKSNCLTIKFETPEGNICNLSFSDDCPIGVSIINYIIKYDDPLCLLSMINGKNYENIADGKILEKLDKKL